MNKETEELIRKKLEKGYYQAESELYKKLGLDGSLAGYIIENAGLRLFSQALKVEPNLVNEEANFQNDICTVPLITAVRYRKLSIVRKIVESGCLKMTSGVFTTSADAILASTDPKITEFLLNNGFDVNRVNSGFDPNTGEHYSERNALHHLCGCYSPGKRMTHILRTAELLLDRGIQIDQQDSRYNTPLHIAVENEFKSMVKLLVDSGANACLEDIRGVTPKQLMEKSNSQSIRKLAKSSRLVCSEDKATLENFENIKEICVNRMLTEIPNEFARRITKQRDSSNKNNGEKKFLEIRDELYQSLRKRQDTNEGLASVVVENRYEVKVAYGDISSLAECKMGGLAWLNKGESWPHCGRCGKSMALNRQYNLDQISSEIGAQVGTGLFQLYQCADDLCESRWSIDAIHSQEGSLMSDASYNSVLLRVVDPIGNGSIDEIGATAILESLRYSAPPYSSLEDNLEYCVILKRWKSIGIELAEVSDLFDFLEGRISDYIGGTIWGWNEYRELRIDFSDVESAFCNSKSHGDGLFVQPNWRQREDYPLCPECNEAMRVFTSWVGEACWYRIFQCKKHLSRFAWSYDR